MFRVFILASLGLAACGPDPAGEIADDDGGGSAQLDDTGVVEAAAPTFAELQAQVLEPSCGGAGCHNESTYAGSLLLEGEGAWDSLLNDPCSNEIAVAEGLLRVDPEDLSNSFLYLKVTDPMGMGDPMPPWGSLDDDELELIAAWIEAGAKR